jgi:hypothetical protein
MNENFPMIDVIDHNILMHRDAHFGGLFSVMLDYYEKDGKGVQPEFDIPRIQRLAELEGQIKENLAGLFLSGEEAEKVGEARTAYKNLRDIYDIAKPKLIFPQLIADLVLSEEEDPKQEIEAVVNQKERIVPWLIEVLRKKEFSDPLFPGYGFATSLVVECLGRIGDKKAIISLFEELGQGDFFSDEQVVYALHKIGEPARDFLLRVVAGRPLTEDNERAAIGLVAFQDDQIVAEKCFELLQDPDIQKDGCLSVYLVLACAGMTDPVKQSLFREMANRLSSSSLLRKDMEVVINGWSNHPI